MAGCGVRSVRYGLEAGASEIWVNDADPDRSPWLEENLRVLSPTTAHRISCQPAEVLLAELKVRGQRFDLVDMDAFGWPGTLLPLAIDILTDGGVLYLASSHGRAATGHARTAAVRKLGASARAHPASWELALRLQLGALARVAWTAGRGVEPLFTLSDGRTFRTAVRLTGSIQPRGEEAIGMIAHCPSCGDQQVQSLIRLGRWHPCRCGGNLAVSGPLWIGPLQHLRRLVEMRVQAEPPDPTLSPAGRRLLARLAGDPGWPARCWPTGLIARRLASGPPPLGDLVDHLRREGFTSFASGIMPSQLRSDAPWNRILEVARCLARGGTAR
jgi:tRNA (guanine26-N2/guanine27-N2)-dimethyltransferase